MIYKHDELFSLNEWNMFYELFFNYLCILIQNDNCASIISCMAWEGVYGAATQVISCPEMTWGLKLAWKKLCKPLLCWPYPGLLDKGTA